MSKNFMADELSTTQRLLPGLDDALRETGTAVMETTASPGLDIFRAHGGPGLVVPTEMGGLGASLVDTMQVQRVLGARSPSLSIATNMHVCTVIAMPPCPATEELLTAVATHGCYIASGFGEGSPGASVLTPAMAGERCEKGWRISGSKKPCSLARSMDFLTASLSLRSEDSDTTEVGLAIIPADTPGIEVRSFSSSPVMAGSETEEVILTDVEVPEDYISLIGDAQQLNKAWATVFHTFELIVSACYVGVASGLVGEVLERGRGVAAERVGMVGDLETAMASLEAVARTVTDEEDERGVARSLFVRYSTQRVVEQVAAHAAELLGGTAYMGTGLSASLYSAARALAFHPPARSTMAEPLDEYVAGGPLVIP